MVHKYPETLQELQQRSKNLPRSEIKFYTLLDDLSNDWYAWHSIEWASDLRKEHGEADFLIFNANYGFLIIEAKGGLITFENNRYHSRELLSNRKHQLKANPLRQAQKSMYFIKDLYINKASQNADKNHLLKNVNGRLDFPLSYNCGCFFPDCQIKDDFSLSLPPSKIFDYSDLEDENNWKRIGKIGPSPLEDYLISLLEVYNNRVFNPNIKPFFLKLITPSINTYVNIKHYYEIREQQLEKLNQVQDYLLTSLSQKKHCMFKGSAGSGKTFIAMKKAIQLYKEDKKTLFLCFNKELRDSIESYLCEKLNIDSDKLATKISILTLHSLIKILAKALLGGKDLQQLYFFNNNFQFEKSANILNENLDDISEIQIYDAILIDEAQDIHPDLASLIRRMLKNQKKSILYIFFDESQNLFTNKFISTQFGMNPDQDLIVLDKNLRNTVEIGKWIKNATHLGNYSSYSEINGLKVSAKHFSSGKKALHYSIAYIKKKYLNNGIKDDQILILSNEKLNKILPNAYRQQFSYYKVYYLKDQGTVNRIIIIEPNKIRELPLLRKRLQINGDYLTLFKTIQGFKGLERDIVFLLLNKNTSVDLKRDKYIGGSRAKFKLHLYTY